MVRTTGRLVQAIVLALTLAWSAPLTAQTSSTPINWGDLLGGGGSSSGGNCSSLFGCQPSGGMCTSPFTGNPGSSGPIGGYCAAEEPATMDLSGTNAGAGNPINVNTGNKYQREVDMPALPGILGLELVRHYNSANSGTVHVNGILGRGWRLSYETTLYTVGNTVQIIQADGSRLIFARTPQDRNLCTTTNPAHGQVQIKASGRQEEFTWVWPNGRQLSFDARGKLTQIRVATGEFTTLEYDQRGNLMKVIDPQGRSLTLNYLAKGERGKDPKTVRFSGVQSIDTPVGRFSYAYGSAPLPNMAATPADLAANLVRVSLPTSTGGLHREAVAYQRHYLYEDAHFPTLLTGIAVSGGTASQAGEPQRIATYRYNERGMAIGSTHGATVQLSQIERAGPAADQRGESTLIHGHTQAQPQGLPLVVQSAQIGGQFRILETRGEPCGPTLNCPEANVRLRYDASGRIVERVAYQAPATAWRDGAWHVGALTRPLRGERITYDALGRVVRRVALDFAASATDKAPPATRVIEERTYADQSERPTLVRRPSTIAGLWHELHVAYNGAGQPLHITEKGWRPVRNAAPEAIERSTTYRYARLNGRSVLVGIDGPLAGTQDSTRFEWDARGDRIARVHYPAGLQAQYQYDADTGRITRYTGPDGATVSFVYNAQGHVLAIDRAGSVTRFARDADNRVTEVLDPVGQRLSYAYDGTGAITALRDGQNNLLQLMRNEVGELTQARLLNPDGTLAGQAREFGSTLYADYLGSTDAQRRQQQEDGLSNDAILAAIRQSIITAQVDANLARPEIASAPYAPLQQFLARARALGTEQRTGTHTALDHLGRTTTYQFDDFGRLISEHSPVTGLTRFDYDANDRLSGRTRQDGSQVTYTRDAAGRVIALKAVSHTGEVDESTTIRWGAANKPEEVRYAAGAERFRYDAAGRLIEHTQEVNRRTFRLQYAYDDAGRLVSKTLPGGERLRYRYRAATHARAGLLASIALETAPAWTQRVGIGQWLERTVLDELNSDQDRYQSRHHTFGNGLRHDLRLDDAGRIVAAGNSQVGQSALRFDAHTPVDSSDAGLQSVGLHRQVWYSERAVAEATQTLLDRIRSGALSLFSPTQEAGADPAPVQAALHHSPTQIDDLGRTTVRHAQAYRYDSLNRLTQVSASPDTAATSVRYRYNMFGQRIAKTVTQPAGQGGVASKTTYFFHDGAQLVAEADDSGAITKQYVWLDDRPVAMLQSGDLYYVHVDHRNAPLALTDQARRVVWQAQVSDYGHATPAQDGQFGSVVFNLRASNQYHDAETGLHYNTFRYFDPLAQRYLTPDPLGLAVGPDLYAFALGRPHSLSDPLGLAPTGPVSGWSMGDKLTYVFNHAANKLPGEIGDALRELVTPANIATTVAVFGVWAAAQFTPYGWAADIALAGIGYIMLGSAIWDVIKAVYQTSTQIYSAQCESDLKKAGDTLAAGLGQASAGAAAGGATVGAAKIATLLRTIFKNKKAAYSATAAKIDHKYYGNFNPGSTKTAAAANADHKARRGADEYDPWKAGTTVTDTWLNPGQKVYVIEKKNAADPGGWGAPVRYKTVEEAREALSLLKAFKNGDLVVTEYTVISPVPVRQGTVAPIVDKKNPSESYHGGGQQWEFLVDMRDGKWQNYFGSRVSYDIQ